MNPTAAPYLDPISLERLEKLHPRLRAEGLAIYTEICKRLNGRAICRIAYTHRTFAEQAALYAKGRSTKGPVVTSARPGQSYHNYGLAIDIVLLKDTDGNGTYDTASWETTVDFDGDGKADWMECVEVFTAHGWQWGLMNNKGQRYDLPHFQKTLGYSITTLLSLYGNKRVDKNNYPLI